MEASGKLCPYKVLGLRRGCTAEEIELVYKKKTMLFHPDKLVESGLSEAEGMTKFQQLVEAYNVLSDPERRANYDYHLFKTVVADAVALVKERDERRARTDYEMGRKRSQEMLHMLMSKRGMDSVKGL